MKHNSNECWMHNCLAWHGSSDMCADCKPGWFLEYDTGLCVEECDLGEYQLDFNKNVCRRKCDPFSEYIDMTNYGTCYDCDEGPLKIDNCEKCHLLNETL